RSPISWALRASWPASDRRAPSRASSARPTRRAFSWPFFLGRFFLARALSLPCRRAVTPTRIRRASKRAKLRPFGNRTRRETGMDMSVRVGAAEGEPQRAKTEAKTIARGANASALDAWLEKVEALGELKRITAEVDPDLEAATITYLVGGEKSPALLFENIKGHPGHRALYNMIGCNLSRFCLMIGEQPVDHPLKA